MDAPCSTLVAPLAHCLAEVPRCSPCFASGVSTMVLSVHLRVPRRHALYLSRGRFLAPRVSPHCHRVLLIGTLRGLKCSPGGSLRCSRVCSRLSIAFVL